MSKAGLLLNILIINFAFFKSFSFLNCKHSWRSLIPDKKLRRFNPRRLQLRHPSSVPRLTTANVGEGGWGGLDVGVDFNDLKCLCKNGYTHNTLQHYCYDQF